MLPEWLTVKPVSTSRYAGIKRDVLENGLHTVCAEARCPNIAECWSGGTATFMVLGDLCTRGCRFCAVGKSAKGSRIDLLEPERLGKVVRQWGLNYAVITSVCRDDLPDQGAGHFARCVTEIRKASPNTLVELLIPDFRCDENCLKAITESSPDVVGHNVETVRRLTPMVRDRRAGYDQSRRVLAMLKALDAQIYTKSAIMLGLGEEDSEVIQTMADLRGAGVDFLAVGQYLRPGPNHVEVKEYIRPERFEFFRRRAQEMGFRCVAAGPFVRSSYRAGEFFMRSIERDRQ